jgi:hypothetical protein
MDVTDKDAHRHPEGDGAFALCCRYGANAFEPIPKLPTEELAATQAAHGLLGPAQGFAA